MPRISQLIMTGIAMGFASVAAAVCPYPQEVEVPDGATAATEEMVAGQARVKQYMAEMETYLVCLDNEEVDLGREPTDGELQMRNQRHNAAVDAMETMAAAFNEQIRTYKKVSR